MRRDHQAIWAALGGTIVTAGAAGIVGLLVARAEIAPSPSGENWWRLAMLAAILATLGGAYIVIASLFVPLPLPRLREPMENPPAPHPLVATEPSGSQGTMIAPEAVRPARRIITIDPTHIAELFERHTSIQASKLVEDYVGQWTRVSGTLHDASGRGSGYSQVVFQEETHPRFYMYFSNEEAISQLGRMRRGDQLTVIGRIDRMSVAFIDLRDCEIENSN